MRHVILLLLIAGLPGTAASSDIFERNVRPILVRNCYACHTDSKLGGLRLDSRDALLKGGKRGPAIEPGKPDSSLLIKALTHEMPDLKMPMGSRLPDADIRELRQWIADGAIWPETPAAAPPVVGGSKKVVTPEQLAFWSFQPLAKVSPPEVKDGAWVKQPVDRFILARLEAKGLHPVQPAHKRTLIRRASLDLTGLPPTPEELQAFLDDRSNDAYPKLIDRLLASPRYGERWARHWEDVVRYADSDSSGERSIFANAWRYRDWLVQALNQDLPYDTFVKAQLAADLMPGEKSKDLLPALGFLGMAPWKYSAERDILAEERDDRVDVVSRGLLGLTVACARCHDHKYDPLATEDYYALAGVFANTIYHEYELAPNDVVQAWEQQDERIKKAQAAVNSFLGDQTRQLGEILAYQTARYMTAAWPVLRGETNDVAAVAKAGELDQSTLERWIKYLKRGERLHTQLDKWDVLVKKGGTPDEVQRTAQEFQTEVLRIVNKRKANEEENKIARALHKPRKDARTYMFPNGVTAIEGFVGTSDLAVKPLEREEYVINRDLFLSTRGQFDYVDEDAAVMEYRERDVVRFLAPQWKAHLATLDAGVAALKKAQPSQYPFLMGVTDVAKPEDLRVHIRGSAENLGDSVPRAFPAVLDGGHRRPFTGASGRLELAERIVAHPLTARVMVNRVWLEHFGSGLVDTPSNFGQAGERPTHPELLEYLATRFRDSGWSLKQLHRDIMLSATYQSSTHEDPAGTAEDPANRLYWRANRRRLEVEPLRDSMLFMAGTLDPKIGGPSEVLSEKNNRRTLYAHITRGKSDPLLSLFDFPDPSLHSEKRVTTNVPSQRLFFLNSEIVGVQAEALAKRLQDSATTDAGRVEFAYRLLFSREPTASEREAGLEFLSGAGNPADGWRQYAQTLLSVDEFYYVN